MWAAGPRRVRFHGKTEQQVREWRAPAHRPHLSVEAMTGEAIEPLARACGSRTVAARRRRRALSDDCRAGPRGTATRPSASASRTSMHAVPAPASSPGPRASPPDRRDPSDAARRTAARPGPPPAAASARRACMMSASSFKRASGQCRPLAVEVSMPIIRSNRGGTGDDDGQGPSSTARLASARSRERQSLSASDVDQRAARRQQSSEQRGAIQRIAAELAARELPCRDAALRHTDPTHAGPDP